MTFWCAQMVRSTALRAIRPFALKSQPRTKRLTRQIRRKVYMCFGVDCCVASRFVASRCVASRSAASRCVSFAARTPLYISLRLQTTGRKRSKIAYLRRPLFSHRKTDWPAQLCKKFAAAVMNRSIVNHLESQLQDF